MELPDGPNKKRKATADVAINPNNNDEGRDYTSRRELIDGISQNDETYEMFTTMENLLAVPIEFLFAKIPLNETNHTSDKSKKGEDNRTNLMTGSEYSCFLEVILLSQRLDAISSITFKAMERKMEYQFLSSQLLLPEDPYLIPFSVVLHNVSTIGPNQCIQKAQHELNAIEEQLHLCVTQLRRDSETNWNTASLLRTSGADISANAKESLSIIQEELCSRIEKYVFVPRTKMIKSPSSYYDHSSSLLSSDTSSMKDFCFNLLPWMFHPTDDDGDDNDQQEIADQHKRLMTDDAISVRKESSHENKNTSATNNRINYDQQNIVDHKNESRSTKNRTDDNDNDNESSTETEMPDKSQQSKTVTTRININNIYNAIDMNQLRNGKPNNDDRNEPESESSTQKKYTISSMLLSLGRRRQQQQSRLERIDANHSDETNNDKNDTSHIDLLTKKKNHPTNAEIATDSQSHINDNNHHGNRSSNNNNDSNRSSSNHNDNSNNTIINNKSRNFSSNKNSNENDYDDGDVDDDDHQDNYREKDDDNDEYSVDNDNDYQDDSHRNKTSYYNSNYSNDDPDDDEDDDNSSCVYIGTSPAKPTPKSSTQSSYPPVVVSSANIPVSASQHDAADVLNRMQRS